jgi:hypothetical protein
VTRGADVAEPSSMEQGPGATFDEAAAELCRKGYILESETWWLHHTYATDLSEADLRLRLEPFLSARAAPSLTPEDGYATEAELNSPILISPQGQLDNALVRPRSHDLRARSPRASARVGSTHRWSLLQWGAVGVIVLGALLVGVFSGHLHLATTAGQRAPTPLPSPTVAARRVVGHPSTAALPTATLAAKAAPHATWGTATPDQRAGIIDAVSRFQAAFQSALGSQHSVQSLGGAATGKALAGARCFVHTGSSIDVASRSPIPSSQSMFVSGTRATLDEQTQVSRTMHSQTGASTPESGLFVEHYGLALQQRSWIVSSYRFKPPQGPVQSAHNDAAQCTRSLPKGPGSST